MKRTALILFLVAAPALNAQQPGDDPIGRHLISPELVMTHAEKIGLSSKQRAAIKGEVQKMQARFIDLQWDMQEQTGRMTELLQQTPVDEGRVLEQADRIMSLEREIKRAHLALLIRIKNSLTAEQIARLEAARNR